MARYLIEMTHGDEHSACVMALAAIEKYGAHLLTQADWGCQDGTHCAWLIAEVDSRDEALLMIPPPFRADARIVQLNKFAREEIASLIVELETG